MNRHDLRRSMRLAALLGAGLLLGLAGCGKAKPPVTAESSPAPSPAPAAAAAAASKSDVPEAVRKALGRWVRTDGGYVLELRNPDLSGALEAGYFNPKPIRVSRAIWMQGGAGLQFVVELNDTGYPGATYVLTYDPRTDRLAGQYTQPAMQQSFEIEFMRQSPAR